MDRSDERTEHHEGNVLDIGNPQSTDHVPSGETDEERRRRRMERGADEIASSTQDENQMEHRGSGVTGADMGIGGEGTDIEESEP